MKKNTLKLALFSALFAFFAFSFNSTSVAAVESNGDPAGICPDGNKICAKNKTSTWHKGNKAQTIDSTND